MTSGLSVDQVGAGQVALGGVEVGAWRRAARRFRQSPLSLIGLGLILTVVLVALVGPSFVPYPRDATGAVNARQRLKPPSAQFLFGTDDVGRDIFTRVVVGARTSLQVAIVVLLVATTLGVTLGSIAGFFGGPVEALILRVTDIFLTVPGLILAMAAAAALGPSLFTVMLAISLVWWPGYCRLTRANVLAVKGLAYVEAARTLGLGQGRILLVHVLPNVISPIIVKASLDLGFAILTTASLGFIGLGVQPPAPDWGRMIADGRKFMPDHWWYATFPGLAILVTVLGFNLLGDGLRDVLDPRTRRA